MSTIQDRELLQRRQAARPTTAETKIGRKLAALAGAAGAAAVGQDAMAITLTETANVVAAQGIPGFTYTSASTVTLGTLRPPASFGTTAWNVDGVAGQELSLGNLSTYAVLGGTILRSIPGGPIRNLVTGNVVSANAAGAWSFQSNAFITENNVNLQGLFTSGTAGVFGFKFGSGASTRYGWAQMTITPGNPSMGRGFVIQQAYYKNDGTAISVGQVPVSAVPEPSSIALLAIGSAGLAAWRLRRKDQPEAASADGIQA